MSELLFDNFLKRAQAEPDRVFAKMYFARQPAVTVTHQSFLNRSLEYGAYYREKQIQSGDVVVILLDHSLDLLASFFGALMYGAIPSIFAPPSPKIEISRYRKSFWESLEVCRPRVIVTDAKTRGLISLDASHRGPAFIDPIESRPGELGASVHRVSDDSIAFLQHSSGTTGLKKGVALSHRAVLNQVEKYGEAIELRATDKIVSWLPLYHDMGLIATFVQSFVSGAPLLLLSPFDWIADPVRLLEVINEEKATLCWQPNFAFTLLAERVSARRTEKLNLSSIRAFINCSEPISAATHEKFLARYQGNGVTPKQLHTCYAMAENTFAVTQSSLGSPPYEEIIDERRFSRENLAVPPADPKLGGRRLISSGKILATNHVRIIGENEKPLDERQVGEIWIQSPSMLTEYYHRADLTSAALTQGWYRTGDLGYLSRGELFVTGRKKDLIIVAGRNIYPSDIEEVVSLVEGVCPGRVVAFGSYQERLGTEEILILAETKLNDPDEVSQLRTTIRVKLSEIEINPAEISFRPYGWLVKSSSGKISRSANREKYFVEKGRP